MATEAETRSTLGQILPARKVSATITIAATKNDRAVGAADVTIAARKTVPDTDTTPTQTRAVFRGRIALLSIRGSAIKTAAQVLTRVTSTYARSRQTTERSDVGCRGR